MFTNNQPYTQEEVEMFLYEYLYNATISGSAFQEALEMRLHRFEEAEQKIQFLTTIITMGKKVLKQQNNSLKEQEVLRIDCLNLI